MKPSHELLASVEQLYTTFSDYPLSQNTYACPCCTTAEQEGKLHSKPLRELLPDDLTHYAWDALLTWGNESTFKHFLPRLFELFLTIPNPSLHLADPEILFSKFRHGHWREWPEFEQDTIRDFIHCFWNDVLNSELRYDKELGYDSNAWETDTYLCSIAQSEDDLTPYLDQWIKNDSLEACFALSGFLLQSGVVLSNNSDRSPFWGGRDEQYAQVKRWVLSPAVAAKLDAAVARWVTNEYAEEFLLARSMLS